MQKSSTFTKYCLTQADEQDQATKTAFTYNKECYFANMLSG